MNDKYTKITYQSDPIGEEKIVLILTTFDIESFENDQKQKHIPKKKIAKVVLIDKSKELPEILTHLEEHLDDLVKETYLKQIEEMKSIIETQRMFIQNTINVQEYGEKHIDNRRKEK